jgi:hypothetical protein
MKRIRVIVSRYARPGRYMMVPDFKDPECGCCRTVAEAKAVVIACHADDEQRVRDAVAVSQEWAE